MKCKYFGVLTMVLFMLTSCQNKTCNLGNTKVLQHSKKTSNTLMAYKKDTLYCFIDSIKPEETIVEERQIQGKKIRKERNTNINVYFLFQDSLTRDGFLNTEIVNHTNDTIFYVSDAFSFDKESNNSWKTLPYPDNFAKTDFGYLILPQNSIQLRLFLPLQKKHSKGKYKLQLVFCNSSQKMYYYINKFFSIK